MFLLHINWHVQKSGSFITMTAAFRMNGVFLNMTLNDANGVSLIVLHCSHECVTLNTVFQPDSKCVTLTLFFSFDASVEVHTCKGVCQK